jgi:elongation factor P--beta-lysine ligase
MKRLLAAGRRHLAARPGVSRRRARPAAQPEFSLLEWYRVGWDAPALMDEVEALLCALAAPERTVAGDTLRLSYREAFVHHAGLDPFDAGAWRVARCAGRSRHEPAARRSRRTVTPASTSCWRRWSSHGLDPAPADVHL